MECKLKSVLKKVYYEPRNMQFPPDYFHLLGFRP